MKQSVYLQEGFGSMPNLRNGPYVNGPSYPDSNPDIFRGMQPGSHIFTELVPSDNDVLGKQFGRPVHGDSYDGQSVLADRVSKQLLGENVLDLSPRSSLPSRTNGV